MHYYPFHVADYRKDTTHLEPIEHYIYRELIDWAYLDEKPIPEKTQLVMRRLRLREDQKTYLENVLSEFFELTENGWIQRRILEEIENYHKRVKVAKANGSKGGRPKGSTKKPKKTNPVNLAKRPVSKKKLTNNQEPITNNQLLKENNNKRKTRFIPPTLAQVEEYAIEKNALFLAGHFFQYYEAGDWTDGKGDPVRNWKQKFITWIKRNEENKRTSNSGKLETNHERFHRRNAEQSR